MIVASDGFSITFHAHSTKICQFLSRLLSCRVEGVVDGLLDTQASTAGGIRRSSENR